MIITQLRVDGHVENLAIVVQMARQVLNVEAAFGLFLLTGNQCLIIGRSISDAINIGTIMRCMGGGGHPGAGSAMIRAINPGVLAAWIRILISGKRAGSGQIRDIMTVSVFTLTPETTMASAFRTLRNRGIHGAPIMNKEQLLGMSSVRDMMRLKRGNPQHLTVKAFMSRPVHTISPWKNSAEAAQLMVKHDIGRLPVVEDGQLVGITIRSDAMGYFYGLCPLDGHLDPACIRN